MVVARHQRGSHGGFQALRRAAAALLGAAALAGTAMAADFRLIEGQATYLDRRAIGPDAQLTVLLLDVSRADAPATVLASILIVPDGQVPVPFSLTYDAGAVDPRFSHVLAAELRSAGRLTHRTTTAHPVLTRGAPTTDVTLVMDRVAQVAPTPAGAWRVTSIRGRASAEGVTTTLDVGQDGSLSGSGGCNRFRGQAKIDGDRFEAGPAATTMMACPEPQAAQERAFFSALSAVVGWRIEDRGPDGRHLVLLDAAGDGVVMLTPAP